MHHYSDPPSVVQQAAKTDDRYYASYYADKTSPRTPPYKRGDTSDNYATLTPSERLRGMNAIQQQQQQQQQHGKREIVEEELHVNEQHGLDTFNANCI